MAQEARGTSLIFFTLHVLTGQLKKEERAHDDRMNDSNTRIKQAGTSHHVAIHCVVCVFSTVPVRSGIREEG